MIERVPATLAMAVDLAPRLRQADRDEVMAASGKDAGDSLIEAMGLATFASALLVNGRAEAIAGVCPFPGRPEVGIVWMLAGDVATVRRKDFLSTNRGFIAECLDHHPTLTNFVDNRNTQAQQWLRWLGFKLFDPVPFGISGLPFRRFLMEKANYRATRHSTAAPSGASVS